MRVVVEGLNDPAREEIASRERSLWGQTAVVFIFALLWVVAISQFVQGFQFSPIGKGTWISGVIGPPSVATSPPTLLAVLAVTATVVISVALSSPHRLNAERSGERSLSPVSAANIRVRSGALAVAAWLSAGAAWATFLYAVREFQYGERFQAVQDLIVGILGLGIAFVLVATSLTFSSEEANRARLAEQASVAIAGRLRWQRVWRVQGRALTDDELWSLRPGVRSIWLVFGWFVTIHVLGAMLLAFGTRSDWPHWLLSVAAGAILGLLDWAFVFAPSMRFLAREGSPIRQLGWIACACVWPALLTALVLGAGASRLILFFVAVAGIVPSALATLSVQHRRRSGRLWRDIHADKVHVWSFFRLADRTAFRGAVRFEWWRHNVSDEESTETYTHFVPWGTIV